MVVRLAGMPIENINCEFVCETHSMRLLDDIIENSLR
jgi:hypothetical protein